MILILLLFVGVDSACPNACSNHGVCGEYDACSCHANWIGADCSLRQCMSGISWVTTARGDLNYDGDTNDATVHQSDIVFTGTSVEYVKTQSSPGGDWEKWPSTFDPVGEAHFYMECSNRGLCDRETGECNCFEGYTGQGCRRTTCPDDCSGHGLCQTIGQQKGSHAYELWDAEMSRSCVCDPGFGGPNCAARKCPVGDDPLTVDDQHETQWVDISLSTKALFSGTVTLAYTDPNTETWVTAPFAIAPFHGQPTGTSSSAQAALRALPHDMLGSVIVTEEHCSSAIPGTGQFSGADAFTPGSTNGYARTMVDGDAFHCPSATSNSVYIYNSGGITQADGTPATAQVEDGLACNLLKSPYCVRLVVRFGGAGNTGDVADLVVDTSSVKIASGESSSNELNSFATVVDVTSMLSVVLSEASGGVTASYTTKATDDKSCAAGACTITSSTKTLSLDADGAAFGSSERVKIWCGATKLLGTFTVVSSDATTVTTLEVVPSCDGVSGNEVLVKRVSDYIEVNADVSLLVSPGARVAFTDTGTYKGSPHSREVLHVKGVNGRSFVYLDNDEFESSSKDFHTSDIPLTTADGTTRFEIYGSGTSESSPCSDRGVCDGESGECACFAGYTGYACNLQNNLAI